MFTSRARRGAHPQTSARTAIARLRRLAAVLTVLVAGLLASAATIPAAFAQTARLPIPTGGGDALAGAASAITRVVVVGGMPGWQIALIAIGAALLAATSAVLAYRAMAARGPAVTATA